MMFRKQQEEPEKRAWDGTASLKGGIYEISFYGDAREASGVATVVLEPVEHTFTVEIGAEVVMRVTEIRREVVER